MRKTLLATLVLGLGFTLSTAPRVRAAEEEKEMKGTLIDQHCGEKMKTEEAAAKHTKECCMKCADSGFALISGKKEMKLDDESSKKAKEYLEKHDSLKVVVKGMEKDGKLAVSSIEEQKEEK